MESFLNPDNRIGVVGVSKDKEKWGYRLYVHLRDEGLNVYPVNPKYVEIDGQECFPDVTSVDDGLDVVVTVVPPEVTEEVVEQCVDAKIGRVWMQPGSESDEAVEYCKKNGIEVVHDACMVTDGFKQTFLEI